MCVCVCVCMCVCACVRVCGGCVLAYSQALTPLPPFYPPVPLPPPSKEDQASQFAFGAWPAASAAAAAAISARARALSSVVGEPKSARAPFQCMTGAAATQLLCARTCWYFARPLSNTHTHTHTHQYTCTHTHTHRHTSIAQMEKSCADRRSKRWWENVDFPPSKIVIAIATREEIFPARSRRGGGGGGGGRVKPACTAALHWWPGARLLIYGAHHSPIGLPIIRPVDGPAVYTSKVCIYIYIYIGRPSYIIEDRRQIAQLYLTASCLPVAPKGEYYRWAPEERLELCRGAIVLASRLLASRRPGREAGGGRYSSGEVGETCLFRYKKQFTWTITFGAMTHGSVKGIIRCSCPINTQCPGQVEIL